MKNPRIHSTPARAMSRSLLSTLVVLSLSTSSCWAVLYLGGPYTVDLELANGPGFQEGFSTVPLDSGLIGHDSEGLSTSGRAISDSTGLKGFLSHSAGPDFIFEIAPQSSFYTSFSDTLQVASPGREGEQGSMRIRYRIDGSLGVLAPSDSASVTFIDHTGSLFPFDEELHLPLEAPPEDLGDIVIFDPYPTRHYTVDGENSPLIVNEFLDVYYPITFAGPDPEEVFVNIELTGTLSGLGEINFLNTAEIEQIEVQDDTGQTIGNAAVSGGSGSNYSGFVVPEPSSTWLLFAGLSSCLLRRRRS